MKTREFQELQKRDVDELEKIVAEKRSEVMNLRFSLATGALENSARLGQAKRDVARVMTVLNQKRSTAGAATATGAAGTDTEATA